GIAHPHPHHLIFFDRRVAAHASVRRDLLLPGNAHTAARSVDNEAVVAALDPLLDNAAHTERRGAMATAVSQRSNPARTVAEQHDRLVADAAPERLCAADL